MFQPRSIPEILRSFFRSLQLNNSPLTAIAPGDGVYTLGRAISAMQADQDILLNTLVQNASIASAKGVYLDKWVANFGITRKSATVATGSVLLLSNSANASVPAQTVFTEPNTGVQVLILSSTSSTVVPFIEQRIDVTVLTVGAQGNLTAGTKLISPEFPDMRILVGTHRDQDGSVCGDLKGGRDTELDSDLISRAINLILTQRFSTKDAIKARLLLEPSLTYVSIASPLPGIIQLWVDGTNELVTPELNRLKSIVENIKPVGTTVTIEKLVKAFVDVNIFVVPSDRTTDLDDLTRSISAVARQFFNNLEVNEPYSKAALAGAIRTTPGISYVEIRSPTSLIIEPEANQVIRSRSILITNAAD